MKHKKTKKHQRKKVRLRVEKTGNEYRLLMVLRGKEDNLLVITDRIDEMSDAIVEKGNKYLNDTELYKLITSFKKL